MATEDAFQEAVAFLQKNNSGGESVYDQLAKVVGGALYNAICSPAIPNPPPPHRAR